MGKMTPKKLQRIFLFGMLLITPIVIYAVPDLGTLLQNVKKDMPRLLRFITAVSYFAGLWFAFSGVYELRIFGQSRVMMPTNVNMTGPMIRLIVGMFMMFLPSFVNISVYTLWHYGSSSVLLYPNQTKAGWRDVMEGTIAVVRLIGYIAFIRGLILVTRSAKQGAPQGLLAKAMTHIIGGILAINVVGTLDALKGTFGWT